MIVVVLSLPTVWLKIFIRLRGDTQVFTLSEHNLRSSAGLTF